MRKRIFFFHTLTLVAAMLALLAVNWGVLHWTISHYQRQAVPAANGPSEQVRAIFESWDVDSGDWSDLDRLLRQQNYHLVVTQDDRALFSSLDQGQADFYFSLAEDAAWPEQGTIFIQTDGMVMVGRRMNQSVAAALPTLNVSPVLGRHRPQGEAVLLSMLVGGASAISIIFLLSLLFTRYQIKQIMRPVNALADAAKRVRQGNLSTPVAYHGRDEFAAVCSAFDQMQSHLQNEQEKTAAYERARTDMVAGISHDLRTPLTSVKGYIKGLRDGVANTPEKRALYLDTAYRKADEMERLLQRLFYFSNLETGNLPLAPIQTDLNNFIQRFADAAEKELSLMGGRVEFQGWGGPLYVLLDEEQMHRVLTNLKENSLHYGQADPLVLTLTVERQDNWACLRFADNGCGVDPAHIPHLFEQFWRGDQARGSRGGDGSGLGLYIVKYIVEAHGGTIQAHHDAGLVFEILLPCGEGD